MSDSLERHVTNCSEAHVHCKITSSQEMSIQAIRRKPTNRLHPASNVPLVRRKPVISRACSVKAQIRPVTDLISL